MHRATPDTCLPLFVLAFVLEKIPDDGVPRDPYCLLGRSEGEGFPHRAHLGVSSREG